MLWIYFCIFIVLNLYIIHDLNIIPIIYVYMHKFITVLYVVSLMYPLLRLKNYQDLQNSPPLFPLPLCCKSKLSTN